MLGSPNRPIRDIFEFSFLPLLAHIFLLQFQPISESRKIQREPIPRVSDSFKRNIMYKIDLFIKVKKHRFLGHCDGGRKFIINFYMTPIAGPFTGFLLLRTCYSP